VSGAPDALEGLVARLERAVARLREGDLEPDEAARLVEQCAALAAEASSELERRSREAGAGGDEVPTRPSGEHRTGGTP
jgi:hypothetical protein